MRRSIVFAACLCLAGAPAIAAPVVLKVLNHSTKTISGLNTYPVDADGDFVEDNIGGFFDPVPPGGTGSATLNGTCGPILAVVGLVDGAELRTTLDTCKQRMLVLTD